ncbi:hypothetical protein EDB83DRAFT_2445152, partial [Lactarius deliciosus]
MCCSAYGDLNIEAHSSFTAPSLAPARKISRSSSPHSTLHTHRASSRHSSLGPSASPRPLICSRTPARPPKRGPQRRRGAPRGTATRGAQPPRGTPLRRRCMTCGPAVCAWYARRCNGVAAPAHTDARGASARGGRYSTIAAPTATHPWHEETRRAPRQRAQAASMVQPGGGWRAGLSRRAGSSRRRGGRVVRAALGERRACEL